MLAAVLLGAALSATNLVARSVDARLAAASPTNGLARFVGYPNGAKQDTFTPNPAFWAKDVDFSCASPWNSVHGNLRAGTLISKRHVLFAKHFPLAKGARILFVDRKGDVCPCRIADMRPIANSDAVVGLLNYEVTPNIRPAKILPLDWAGALGAGAGLPVVTLNQKEEAVVGELGGLSPLGGGSWIGARQPDPGTLRGAFARRIVSGDSGNPVFLLVGNEPVLVYCLHTGGGGGGPAVHALRIAIQAAMDALAPGYRLETVDLVKRH